MYIDIYTTMWRVALDRLFLLKVTRLNPFMVHDTNWRRLYCCSMIQKSGKGIDNKCRPNELWFSTACRSGSPFFLTSRTRSPYLPHYFRRILFSFLVKPNEGGRLTTVQTSNYFPPLLNAYDSYGSMSSWQYGLKFFLLLFSNVCRKIPRVLRWQPWPMYAMNSKCIRSRFVFDVCYPIN